MDINPDDDNERVLDGDSDEDDDGDSDEEDDGDTDGDDDDDSDNQMELSYITLFGRTTSTICTTSNEYVNLWITRHIHNRNYDLTSGTKVVVGLDIRLVDLNNLYSNIATISVCINGECLVYHMFFAMELPNCLQRFLTVADPKITFVGVSLQRELRVLRNWAQYSGHITCRNLGFVAARRYNRQELLNANMCELAYAVLGKRLVIPPANPDWDGPVLLQEQVLEASVRAYVPYELGRALNVE